MAHVYCNIKDLTVEEAMALIELYQSVNLELTFIINDGVVSALVTNN